MSLAKKNFLTKNYLILLIKGFLLDFKVTIWIFDHDSK